MEHLGEIVTGIKSMSTSSPAVDTRDIHIRHLDLPRSNRLHPGIVDEHVQPSTPKTVVD
jgi:hypothetical protein